MPGHAEGMDAASTAELEGAVELNLTLCLPRDELSIPVVRQVCKNALTVLGVERGCIGDIEVAITEACANVLHHSGADDEYEVRVQIDDSVCVIRVIDGGRGFDYEALGAEHGSDVSAESGRGISLITALVDKVSFDSRPEDGTIVHLEKVLEYQDGAPIERLRTK